MGIGAANPNVKRDSLGRFRSIGYLHEPENILKRFARYVQRSNDHWIWVGGKTGKGYGMFSLGANKRVIAHRFAWEVQGRGKLRPRQALENLCGYTYCVNPDHWRIGVTRQGRVYCPNGHKYLPGSYYVHKQSKRSSTTKVCKQCRLKTNQQYQKRRRQRKLNA